MDTTAQLVLVVAGFSLALIVGALLVIARRDRRLAEGRTSAASTIASDEPMAPTPHVPAVTSRFERSGLTPARARRFLAGRRAGS